MEDMLTSTERSNLDMDTHQAAEASESGVSGNEQTQLGDLPEVCMAMILSFLSPREVMRLACVCRSFHAASNFDSVWENILPPKYKDLLALDPDVVPAQFASKREVFDHLCNLVFFANNTQGFWLDRETGGVCLSIAARGIDITWADTFHYWDWLPDQNSLFPEVARLKSVCWFEAKGEIECSLPPGRYTFSWRLLLGELRGWRSEPAHFTLCKNDREFTECKCYIDPSLEVSTREVDLFNLPTIRDVENGWKEYDVGEFLVEKGEDTCLLKFAILAVEEGHWKSGLCLDGVVVRPTKTIRQSQLMTLPRAESGFHTPEFQPEAPEFQFHEEIQPPNVHPLPHHYRYDWSYSTHLELRMLPMLTNEYDMRFAQTRNRVSMDSSITL